MKLPVFAHQSSRLTREETSRAGPLFYHFITVINPALGAVIAAVVVALSRAHGDSDLIIIRPTRYARMPAMRTLARSCSALLVLSAAAGVFSHDANLESVIDTSPLHASSFQVRGSADAPLNVDIGWAAGIGEEAEVSADQPFRIRFEVEAPAGTEDALPTRFTLQVRRNGGEWQTLQLRDFPYPDEISTPRVSLVRVDEWETGLPTADLLAASTLPFSPGEGVSDILRTDGEDEVLEGDNAAATWPRFDAPAVAPVHGEWEWPVVIRRWADGAVTNQDGDTFDFRMLDGTGRPVDGAGPVRVILRIPSGLLGGTYVETPGVLGPWQRADGTLYFPMEPAETFNVLMMVASADHGASWLEVDGANRPATDDLEGFATTFHDGVIFLLHQISEATYLHAFDTRATPTENADTPAGRWVIRDDLVSEHTEPLTQVAAVAARSDGSLVAVYGNALGLLHRVRSKDGSWGSEGRVEVANGGLASGVMAVSAAGGVVHIAYTVTSADGRTRSVWHRTLSPTGSFTDATALGDGVGTAEDEIGALLPLGWEAASNTVIAAWRRADGTLWERRIGGDGSVGAPVRITSRPVVQSGADSEQVGADLVVHDGVVHVVFIDEATRDLWYTSSPEPGTWSTARPVVEEVDAQWVRGRVVLRASGAAAYALVYDAGSDGGSGMNRYQAITLRGNGG